MILITCPDPAYTLALLEFLKKRFPKLTFHEEYGSLAVDGNPKNRDEIQGAANDFLDGARSQNS